MIAMAFLAFGRDVGQKDGLDRCLARFFLHHFFLEVDHFSDVSYTPWSELRMNFKKLPKRKKIRSSEWNAKLL